MKESNETYGIRLRTKIGVLFLLTLIGIPMLYSAYLNFQVQEIAMGLLMVGLFILWAVAVTRAFNFKVILSDSSVKRRGVFSPTKVDFKEVHTIHFGTFWSNFYIQAGDTKLYVSKDFEDYENIIKQIVDKVQKAVGLETVELSGNADKIEQFT